MDPGLGNLNGNLYQLMNQEITNISKVEKAIFTSFISKTTRVLKKLQMNWTTFFAYLQIASLNQAMMVGQQLMD